MILPPLLFGTFIRRYKRFMVDVLLDGGQEITAHCPNPGAMLGVLDRGNRVALSKADNPLRKLPYTWQYVYADSCWIGVNTHLTNELVADALARNMIPELSGYDSIQREVKYGTNSRIDFLLTGQGRSPCYLEVKNVHLKRNGIVQFPDCVTARGAKHMAELAGIRKQGMRCVVLYCVQRPDCTDFSLADDIDPFYAESSTAAVAAGTEMLAYSFGVKELGGSLSALPPSPLKVLK